MSISINAKGTTVPYFTIGKNGTTIYQGTADPSGSYTIKNGDYWFNSTASTLNVRVSNAWSPPGLGVITFPSGTGTSGQVLSSNGSGALSWATVPGMSTLSIADGGTGATTAAAARVSLGVPSISNLRNYIDGYILNPASSTMNISVGIAMDSSNVELMSLVGIAKTTSTWAVGTSNGGLDTGSVANNTWYHFYIIKRTDTGVVDALFSTSATLPSLPTNYDRYRRIGSAKTNGSAIWTSFYQIGDTFWWSAPVLDINSSSFADSSTLYTISTPLGVMVDANMTLFKLQGTSGIVNIWSPVLGAIGASTTVSPLGKGYSDSASGASINTFDTLTNTSSQIYGGSSANNQTVKCVTNGWKDSRGRNA